MINYSINRCLYCLRDSTSSERMKVWSKVIFIIILSQLILRKKEGNSKLNWHRSKAIKPRHWEIISKVCGFDAIRDGEEVIDVLTLEDFINLGLEKQGSEIKSIIGKFIDFNMISYLLVFEIDELHLVMGLATLQMSCLFFKTS